FGIGGAPLVRIGRVKQAGEAEGVRGFLRQPPGVFAVPAVVVIAAAEPIHGRDVDGVAPHIFEGAVVSAVAADLGMAVEFAADDLQVFAADIRAVFANAVDFGALLLRGVARLSAGIGLNFGGDQRGGLGDAAGLEAAGVEVVIGGLPGLQNA